MAHSVSLTAGWRAVWSAGGRIGRKALIGLSAGSLVLSACGGATPATSGRHHATTLLRWVQQGANPDVFNPYVVNFQGANAELQEGLIYESLLNYDLATDAPPKPWLATSYRWSDDDKTLALFLRKGVKWSDGAPFTSADVVYSLNILKRYPALDTVGITFSSVRAVGRHEVTLHFSRPSGTELYYIGSQVWILPQHVWAHVKNPAKYADPHPVGTGPYTVKSWSQQQIVLRANPHYWQPGRPEVKSIVYQEYESEANQDLHDDAGGWDLTSNYWPTMKSVWLKKSSFHHYWYPPVTVVVMFPNDQKWPFNNPDVRKAVEDVVNKGKMSVDGDQGFLTPASPVGLPMPTARKFLTRRYQQLSTKPNVGLARKLMRKAGFHKSAGGFWKDKTGRTATASIMTLTCCFDTRVDGQIMAQEMTSFGIKTTQRSLADSTAVGDQASGNFSLEYSDFMGSGPDPYYLYYPIMNDSQLPPMGKPATIDQERWRSPAAQRLLRDYESATTDQARLRIDHQLERLFVDQMPVIPAVNFVGWFEYSTGRWVGWPDHGDPYATTGEPSGMEHIILQLTPRR